MTEVKTYIFKILNTDFKSKSKIINQMEEKYLDVTENYYTRGSNRVNIKTQGMGLEKRIAEAQEFLKSKGIDCILEVNGRKLGSNYSYSLDK